MSRQLSRRRGIVLAGLVAGLALTACTPPMPPDVLAARAESQIQCQSGDVRVSVPESMAGAMAAVGLGLGTVCPEQTVTEVAAGDAAPLALVDRTPTAADITDWDAARCLSGNTIVIPAFMYPVTIAYNVLGLEGVVMTPRIVAGILNGTITSWEDPAIAEANPGFDFTLLPEFQLMSVAGTQGSVEAMTAWLAAEAPQEWTRGVVGTLDDSLEFGSVADLVLEMSVTESTIAVLPIFQAYNNVLPTANLPVTLEAGLELVITSDDVQLYKVGSGASSITTDEVGNIFAGPAVGGVPVDANFDLAASKIVLGEGAPLVGWPVLGSAHLLICDDPSDPLPLSFAQFVVRLAGQGALETFGLTPMPEPIRIQTFPPLTVTVDPNAPVEEPAGEPGIAPSSSGSVTP